MATWHMHHHATFLILFSSPTSPRTRFWTHKRRHKMPMIPVVLKPHQMHLTENDTNKEAEDTENGPIQPSITEHTARRRTAHKTKGRCKCMFGCLINFASLGSSFSPSPSPIPTPSHTHPHSCSVSHPLSHYCSCSCSVSIVLLMYNISFYQCLLYIIPCVNQ